MVTKSDMLNSGTIERGRIMTNEGPVQEVKKLEEGYRPTGDVVQKGYRPVATGQLQAQHPPIGGSNVKPAGSNGGDSKPSGGNGQPGSQR